MIAGSAVVPLGAIGGLASLVVNVAAERRVRQVYLFMELGWVLVGGTVALLARAAEARPPDLPDPPLRPGPIYRDIVGALR